MHQVIRVAPLLAELAVAQFILNPMGRVTHFVPAMQKVSKSILKKSIHRRLPRCRHQLEKVFEVILGYSLRATLRDSENLTSVSLQGMTLNEISRLLK